MGTLKAETFYDESFEHIYEIMKGILEREELENPDLRDMPLETSEKRSKRILDLADQCINSILKGAPEEIEKLTEAQIEKVENILLEAFNNLDVIIESIGYVALMKIKGTVLVEYEL